MDYEPRIVPDRAVRALFLITFSILSAVSQSFAQEVAPPSAADEQKPAVGNPPAAVPEKKAAKSTSSDEEVIELSPFVVTASEDEGYQAQNTLAGSRLNASLRDTPGVLDVLTPEFMADIGATSLEDALSFSANYAEDFGDFDSNGVINTVFAPQAANATFRTRGLGGSTARNYLETNFRPQFYTIERIDNSSGPNSILFGLGSAGGVASVSTKRARLNRDDYGVDFRIDEYESKEVTVDTNQVLIPRVLGIRANAIYKRANKYRAHFEDNTDGLHLATTWRLGPKTELRAEFEVDHSTGTVAYPGPAYENVTNWIDAGSQTVTLPTNWETLTTAQRNAYASANLTPRGLAVSATAERPVVVQGNGQTYVQNSAINVISTGINRQSIRPEVFDPEGNINGPGGTKGVDRKIWAIAIDQKVTENFYLNLSGAREYGSAETYQAYALGSAGGFGILADASTTIPYASRIRTLEGPAPTTTASGQVANPYVGQYYVESRWLHRTLFQSRDIIQGTAAYQLDLGRWGGSHRMVASTSYQETTTANENYRESWLGAPFGNDPYAVGNGLVRRGYAVSPRDVNNFHIPDWRGAPTVTYNHPTRGLISSGWLSEGLDLKQGHQYSYLAALQSHLLNRRLVVTTGYRVDNQTDYSYGKMQAPGGLDVFDRNSVRKSNVEAKTHTIGGVLHVTDWVSAYYNRSSNVGPARGNRVGPDAVVPEGTEGEGLDTGLKFRFLKNRIHFDVGYFDTSSTNVTELMSINVNGEGNIRGAYNRVFRILANPSGTAPLASLTDPAYAEALKAQYPLLRPTWGESPPGTNIAGMADLLDQSSSGYEARLTANLTKGLRVRMTASKTERQRENLYKFALPMSEQLAQYIADLQAANPGVDVYGLTSPSVSSGLTVRDYLGQNQTELVERIDQNSANFGSGKETYTAVVAYSFQKFLKGLTVSANGRYQGGAYLGTYEVREGGVSSGKLIDSAPIFGNSTTNVGAMLRYARRFGKTRVTFQLNVTNLQNNNDPILRRVNIPVIGPGDAAPTEFQGTSYFIQNPRTWSFSTKFDF